MKTSTIIGIAAGGLVLAAVATTLVVSSLNRAEQPAASPATVEAPELVPAAGPSAVRNSPRIPRQPSTFQGTKELQAPEPIKASDYVRNAVKLGVQPRRPGAAPAVTGRQMPVSGPVAPDRTIAKATALRKEGRFDEASKLLRNALMTETNPYYRKLLENEIKAGATTDRKPAGSDTTFK